MGYENNIVIGHHSDTTGISKKPVLIFGDNIKKDTVSNCFIFENDLFKLIVGKIIFDKPNTLHEILTDLKEQGKL